jgi:hypothetical protein
VAAGAAIAALGCGASSATDKGTTARQDAAAADASSPEPDASREASLEAAPEAASPSVAGALAVYELADARAKTLAVDISFYAPAPHDYDDRSGGLGCTADHYGAARPRPPDFDGGLLRISGFAGETLLSGGMAAEPIVCTRSGDRYVCSYPTGQTAANAAFPASASPLGAGPVAFAGNGGADVGAFFLTAAPDEGTVAVAEDLASVRYDPAQDAVFHPTCSPACPSSRIGFALTATGSAPADAGTSNPGPGVVRCVSAPAASISIPHGAIAAALASDAQLDTIATFVVRLPSVTPTTRDHGGTLIAAEVGRGVAGTVPR